MNRNYCNFDVPIPFPNAAYTDVVGLCKAASKEEYIDEQDYSLNAGRYVGVEIEDDTVTEREFKKKIINLHSNYVTLTRESKRTENTISANIKSLIE